MKCSIRGAMITCKRKSNMLFGSSNSRKMRRTPGANRRQHQRCDSDVPLVRFSMCLVTSDGMRRGTFESANTAIVIDHLAMVESIDLVDDVINAIAIHYCANWWDAVA